MAIRIVQSKQNPRLKELRAAVARPTRSASGLIPLEGHNLLAEALRSNLEIETIFIAQTQESLLQTLDIPASVEILSIPRDLLNSAVSTESPQPIAALAHPREWQWPNLLQTKPALLVVLAAIQDPGNLGTILRSAEAFGATGAILLPGTVSRWNPKATRASAGSVFRLPTLHATEEDCFRHLREAGIQTLAAMAHQAHPLSSIDLTQPAAMIIGSEGSGLSEAQAAYCDARITIPTPGPVESLNAAVAASILLYEASRQRSASSPARHASNKRQP